MSDIIKQIKDITDKCIDLGLIKELKTYTIPCMRNYQLKYNPTADNRKTPWLYLIQQIKDTDTIDSDLQDFIDEYIKEANQCIEDNKTKKQENIKICENEQDINTVLEIANSVRDKYVKKRGPGVFLAGCCIEASDELAQILKDKGYKAESIDGYAIFDDTENSEITYDEHTLVKVDIGNKTYYLDITCEQFEYYIDECETNKIIFQNYCPYWFSEVKPDMDKYTESKSKKQESDFVDYNKRIEEYTLNELNTFIDMLNKKYPNIKVSEPIKSKKGEYRLKLTHKNLIITIMLMEVLATDSGKPEYAISYNGRQEYIGPKEEVIEFIDNFIVKDYNLNESKGNTITLYHNTTNANAITISKEGIKGGMRLNAYGKGSEAEGAGVWCSSVRGYGYGGATITFEIDENDEALTKQNDIEYIVYRDIKPEEIKDIDLIVTTVKADTHPTVESDIPTLIKKFGKEKLFTVLEKYQHNFVEPYNMEQLKHLVETGEKYCKGKIKLNEDFESNKYVIKGLQNGKTLNICSSNNKEKLEQIVQELKPGNPKIDFWIEQNKLKESLDIYLNKEKLEEASRNELLAKTKMQTLARYKRADGYRGFSLVDVDTDHLLTTDTLPVTCKVGKYWDTVELQDVLYWIQYEAEKNKDNQVNNHAIRDAILKAVDAMDIKVDCNCGDFIYRFAYFNTEIGSKYGKPENRPAKITNPNNYGALCKHLTAMLSNKKWMQQVAAPVMDWFEKHIEQVNKWLRVKEGQELTLPNELARKNAKLGAYAKMFDKIEAEEQAKQEAEQQGESNE